MTGHRGATGPAGPGASAVGSEISFHAYRNDNTQCVSPATLTQVLFPKVEFNIDGSATPSAYDVTNSRFTPGVPGRYQLSAGLTFSNVAAPGAEIRILITKNGSQDVARQTIATVDEDNDGYFNPSMDCSVIVDANATDYFEVYTWHDDSTARCLNGASNKCYFEGALVTGGPGLTGATGPRGPSGGIALRGGGNARIDISADTELNCAQTDIFHVKVLQDAEIDFKNSINGQFIFIMLETQDGSQNTNWGSKVYWPGGMLQQSSSGGYGILYRFINIKGLLWGVGDGEYDISSL